MSPLTRAVILLSFTFTLYVPDNRDSPSTYYQPQPAKSKADCEQIKKQLVDMSGRGAVATDCYEVMMQVIDLTPRPPVVPAAEDPKPERQ